MPLALLQMIARCTCTHATRARRPGPPRLLKQHRTRCGTRRRRRARCGLCYPHTCRERCHRNCCGRCQKRCRIAGWSRPHSASTVRPPGPQTGGTNGSGRPPCGLWWAAHCGSVAKRCGRILPSRPTQTICAGNLELAIAICKAAFSFLMCGG